MLYAIKHPLVHLYLQKNLHIFVTDYITFKTHSLYRTEKVGSLTRHFLPTIRHCLPKLAVNDSLSVMFEVSLSSPSLSPCIYTQGPNKRYCPAYFNSFAANVADRRRHSRLPTSPIGDLDPPP